MLSSSDNFLPLPDHPSNFTWSRYTFRFLFMKTSNFFSSDRSLISVLPASSIYEPDRLFISSQNHLYIWFSFRPSSAASYFLIIRGGILPFCYLKTCNSTSIYWGCFRVLFLLFFAYFFEDSELFACLSDKPSESRLAYLATLRSSFVSSEPFWGLTDGLVPGDLFEAAKERKESIRLTEELFAKSCFSFSKALSSRLRKEDFCYLLFDSIIDSPPLAPAEYSKKAGSDMESRKFLSFELARPTLGR